MTAAEQVLAREVVEFAARWVSRWNAHDVDGILALVTNDIIWEDPSIDGIADGLAEARRYIESIFCFAPTGKTFALEGFDVWDLRRTDARVHKVVSHYDALEFARRAGLMPSRGSSGERVLVRLQRLHTRLGRVRVR